MKIEELLPPEQLIKNRGHSARSAQSSLASGEWKQRTKRGRVFDADVTRHPFSFRGKPSVLVVVQDVTVRKQLEAELQHAQKLESIGQLAAGIAHEINTPMQFIGDNVQFSRDAFLQLAPLIRLIMDDTWPRSEKLLPDGTSSEFSREEALYFLQEVPKALGQALEGTARVSTLVRAMKEFSHPGNKEKRLEDLHRVIDNTITVSRNEWKDVADLQTEYDHSLPAVPCLRGEFNQVILNLIVNAAHAIADVVKDSGTRGTIRIRTRRLPDWAEIQIEDSGPGIPEAIQYRVFDPFFTTKEVGQGTGQGLAIARSVIVEKHQGTIQFSTQIGKGTTFTIRLPLAAEERPGSMG